MNVIFIVTILIIVIVLTVLLILTIRQKDNNRTEYEIRLKELSERLEKQQSDLQRQVSLEFKVMADEIIRQNSDRLNQNNNVQIEALLKPFKERLEQFNKACTDSYINENASRKSLSDQISRLMELNYSIGEEARNLTKALKTDSRTQGQWGETVLQTVLEKGGLTKNVNFFTQQTRDENGHVLHSTEGNGLRPDVIIALPDNHKLIVDSKVSLTAYIDYCNANDSDEADEAGKRHIISVKKHIKELSDKAYQYNIKNCAEQVLMFIPNEGAYLATIKLAPELLDYAYSRNVVIVTPTHLLSVVQLIDQLWKQDIRSKNAEQIASLGGLLYDKFVKLTEDMRRMEKALSDARTSFDNCYKSITSGPTSLISRAEKLKKLGAKNKKTIDPEILDNSELDE